MRKDPISWSAINKNPMLVHYKSSLNIWKFSVLVLLKPSLENFERYLLACDMSAVVQSFEHSLALPFFGIRMKTDLFQSCGHC